MGACQQAAGDAAPDDCQQAAASGYQSCGADQFKAYFFERAGQACQEWAATVTEVDPLTGKWVPRAAAAGGRRLLTSAAAGSGGLAGRGGAAQGHGLRASGRPAPEQAPRSRTRAGPSQLRL